MTYLFLVFIIGIVLWFLLKCITVTIFIQYWKKAENNKVVHSIIAYLKTRTDVKIFLTYLSSMVAIAGYGPEAFGFALEALCNGKYVKLVTYVDQNSGWESVLLGSMITFGFGIFLLFRYKKEEHPILKEIGEKTDKLIEGQTTIDNHLSAGLEEIKNMLVDKSQINDLSSIVTELDSAITSLRVRTALNLLEKLDDIIKNTSSSQKLKSHIIYEKALCQRHLRGENYKKSFHEAYSLMLASNDFNADIIGGEIMALLLEKNSQKAEMLSLQLRERNIYSVWSWIPELMKSETPKEFYGVIPQELKINDSILGEVLLLESNMPFTSGLITDQYKYVPLSDITNDNFCIWILQLSVALNKLLHQWHFDSASKIDIEQQEQCLKEFYSLSDKYLFLLEKTECNNILPDILFLHDFCAFSQSHQRVYLDQINQHLPTENFKEVYALMKINMLSVLNLKKEAIEYIDSLEKLSCDELNLRLGLSMEMVDIQNVKKSFQLAIEQSIIFPMYRYAYFIPALKFYSRDIFPLSCQIKFENSNDEIVYHLIARHYNGENIDLSILKDKEKLVCPLLKILIADVYKDKGNVQDAVTLAKESLEKPIPDFRSFIYIDILKASERSGSELYHYLRLLRENGFIDNDSWLADEANLAVGMSDFESALAPMETLYSRHPDNHNILEKYLIVLDKIGKNCEIEKITAGIDSISIEPEWCANIFNVLIRNGLTERAVSFLYHAIIESNDQSLRALYYSAALNNNIGKIIMQQPSVITSGNYVLLDQDNQETYEVVLKGSRLDELIGCKIGDEMDVKFYNGNKHFKVKSIFTKYYKLLREVSNDAQNNRFREFTCFTLEDLKAGDGDILGNLEKITSSISGSSRKDRENSINEYRNGKLPLGLLVNNNELVGGIYEKLFGKFHIYVPLASLAIRTVQEANYDVSKANYVLDLTSLLMLEEIDSRFHLNIDKRFLIPRGLYQLILDSIKREEIGVYSFLPESVFKRLVILSPRDGESPLSTKLRQVKSWIEVNCQVVTAESKVDLVRNSKRLNMDYMDIESESMILALQPNNLLLTEDLGIIHMLSKAMPIMNIEPWIKILYPTLAESIVSFLSKNYYVGLHLSDQDVFDICISLDREWYDILEPTIALNPLIWENVISATNKIVNSEDINSKDELGIKVLSSLFKHFSPQLCLQMSTATCLKYKNEKIQKCIISTLKCLYPGIFV